MSKFAWIIDDDFDPMPDAAEGTLGNARGLMGPFDITPEQAARLKAGEGIMFRLMDDDDNEIYYGRFIGDSESEDGFAPLDDFGTPNSGCTYIEYFREEPENNCTNWRQL